MSTAAEIIEKAIHNSGNYTGSFQVAADALAEAGLLCTPEEREILNRLRRVWVSGNMDVWIPSEENPRDRYIGYARNLMWWLYGNKRPPVGSWT